MFDNYCLYPIIIDDYMQQDLLCGNYWYLSQNLDDWQILNIVVLGGKNTQFFFLLLSLAKTILIDFSEV